uniref:G_PROTEIN_RECEP_F1_2 domain-containing protein n=1 Tax=Haemonchus contortus TaxID=6289 RepID=A0A7I4XSN3_HAECO
MLDPGLDLGPDQYNISEDCRVQLRRLAEYGGPQPLPLPTAVIIVCCIPMVIIILLTIFGNLLVLFFKARVGRTNTTLLVWNLGLTDFLVGLIVLPLGAFHLAYRKWIFGRFMCRVWVAADVTFCTCSVVTICVISVDRYLAVTRPLRYKSLVTKAKVIFVMIIIWMFSSSILLTTVRWEQPPCYDDSICFAGNEIRYLAHSVVFAFFLPASVTLTLYWRIYKLARNRQRALDRGFLMILGHNMNFLSNTISQQSSTTLRVHFGKNSGMVEHQRRVLRTHERIAKTLGVVSCSFLFCWLPFFSLYLTNYKCQGCIPSIAIDLASWLGYCNSMLNPIIYSFTVKEFKRSALRLIAPTWQFAHGCLPKIFPAPPDRIMQRMSRTGHRARNKTRHRSFELNDKKNPLLNSRCAQKRRQTEPAVFGLQKKVCDATTAPIIIEENEDTQNDFTESNGFTTYNETTRRLSDLPTTPTSMLPIVEMDSTSPPATNGECKSGHVDNSACLIKVFCDTTEAEL